MVSGISTGGTENVEMETYTFRVHVNYIYLYYNYSVTKTTGHGRQFLLQKCC